MSNCKFVRRNKDAWEYGYIQIHEHGTPKEKREHVVVGHTSSMEEALSYNTMAMSSQPKIHPHVETVFRGY